MKRIVSIVLSICLISSFLISCSSTKDIKDLSESDAPKNLNELTDEQKAHYNTVIERRNHVWDELKKQYCTNEIEYFQLDIGKLQEFLQGEGYIQNKRLTKSIVNDVIVPDLHEIHPGSSVPLLLIAKDGNTVLFMYKEIDGTNVLKKSILKNNKWEREKEQREQGSKLEKETVNMLFGEPTSLSAAEARGVGSGGRYVTWGAKHLSRLMQTTNKVYLREVFV